MTIVVGFGYRMGVGKDTACDHIIATHPELDIRKYGFADALREEVKSALFDHWEHDGQGAFEPRAALSLLCLWAGVPYEENAPVTPEYPHGKQRKLLQWWGTEYRRREDPDYWVKRLAERIEREQPEFALIKDVRFLDEHRFVQAAGYSVLVEPRPDVVDLAAEGHRSEHELDVLGLSDWSYMIPSGDLDLLKRSASFVFQDILERRIVATLQSFDRGIVRATPDPLQFDRKKARLWQQQQ